MKSKTIVLFLFVGSLFLTTNDLTSQVAICDAQTSPWGSCHGPCWCTGGKMKDGPYPCNFICNPGLPDEVECGPGPGGCDWEGPAI
jgi:hypothetical protein